MPNPKQCPAGAVLEQFLTGRLPAGDYAGIEEHVPSCPRCLNTLEVLDAKDPLVDALRRKPIDTGELDRGAVDRLVERLRGAVSVAASPGGRDRPGAADVVSLPCPGCGKMLRLRAGLAGKKGKCPSCRQSFRIPDQLGQSLRIADRVGSESDPETVVRDRGPGENTPPVAAGNVSPGADGPVAAELYGFLAPSQQPDEIGRLGNYRVLRVLGAGGMGVVFEAEDIGLHRKVALKTMLPALAASASGRERFLREARAAAAVEHDHIVPIFQVDEDRGVPFIAMPLLKGEPLNGRLQREPILSVQETVRIGKETARGLAAAHAAGLIHRDIKPANLWLEAETGRIKVLDFGLARAAADGDRMTLAGAIVGTPAYMAPEQAGGRVLDGRCDLFSLGCVLYRSVTGQPPFAGDNMISTIMAVATEQPPAPREINPGVPAALSDLILRLLSKEPANRPPDAAAVAAELSAIEQTLADPRAEPVRKARGSRRGRRWGAAAGLAAFLLLTAGLVIRLVHKDGSVTEIPVPENTKVVIEQASAAPHSPAGPAADFDRWVEDTAKLPPEQMVAAVAAMLRQRNPEFADAVRFDAAKPGAAEIAFCTDNVTDASPLRAMTSLRGLRMSLCGSATGKGKLADLSPLSGLPVVSLVARCNPVVSVAPLQKLRLEKLDLTDTRVSDLTPLASIPTLRAFAFSGETTADLTPVWGMPLRSLWLRELEGTPGETLAARVRSLYTLEEINGKPAVDYWEKYDPKHAAFLRWVGETRKLPTEKRIAEVRSKLQERNPNFAEALQTKVNGGEVTDVTFCGDHVPDISPLRAFPRLRVLVCSGNWPWKGKVGDLSPLRGLPLRYLDCRENPDVRDLTPLKNMTTLNDLHMGNTNIRDLTPLTGMRLNHLECYYSQITDLGPLEGMPLHTLLMSGCKVRDLSPLRGVPLHKLDIKQTAVRDFTPLEGSPLEFLDCTLMRAPDLTPLRKTRLKKLFCDHPERNVESISRLWTLEEVNGDGLYAFYQKYSPDRAALMEWVAKTRLLPGDQRVEAVRLRLKQHNPDLNAGEVEFGVVDNRVPSLTLPAAAVTDLSPVRALPDLRYLRCAGTENAAGRLSDLTPLADLTLLEKLDVSRTAVADLTPLCGLRLTHLFCDHTGVRDLSPLKKVPLENLHVDPEVARADRDLLLTIKTLQAVNGRPAAELWKDVGARKP